MSGEFNNILVGPIINPLLSSVNIFAPLSPKTAQKKRNSGVCRVYSPVFLLSQRKNSAIFSGEAQERLNAV
jgi:hypothetical protein